ncbi:hypothetical protein HETIRDRAFT_119472 [Heterobasidion irregulare TC 32-1]|uniref:Uncharacterized protein n=1 Tax=Heterobasidion irregulare (strain TC 32-1) TaxID=747525 RepID=W4KE73_HETIT|nr:uncharacterized protein HETIRDRAFT_119472 [Heterobasidion irregulare TC 32-1]ETW83346.1 hypothetical protein HETIRDRAFT_119472 [Heterobasidion irregulare TC 32-1]
MIFPGPSHIAVARKEINAATSPSSATANAIASSSHPPVSLPRNKRYGTILFPEDAPRRRKLSAAQEVIAKTRAQWAAADTSQHNHDHDHAPRLAEASGNSTDQLKAKNNAQILDNLAKKATLHHHQEFLYLLPLLSPLLTQTRMIDPLEASKGKEQKTPKESRYNGGTLETHFRPRPLMTNILGILTILQAEFQTILELQKSLELLLQRDYWQEV